MTAGNFTVLNVAKIKFLNGTLHLNSDTFKVALVTSSWSPSASYTGTSTDGRYSDLSAAEVSGTGYTAGGATLSSVTLTSSGGTVTFNAAAASWSSATITAKYAVVYSNTAANKDIVGYFDLDTGSGTGNSSTNGTFQVSWNASGLFTVA